MITRYLNRQMLLVLPFLFIFCFPVVTWAGVQALGWEIDWDHGFVGLWARDKAAPLHLSWAEWWSGAFQKNFALWWEHNCPGHFFFLRLFDQVDYTCLNSSYMLQGGILIGPGGALVGLEGALDARHQKTLTPGHVTELIDKLKKMQAELHEQGKVLLVVTTPEKNNTRPEMTPARFRAYDDLGPSPYEQLMEGLSHTTVPFVDGAGIVHRMEEKTPYPLFTLGGIHWTRYAAMQVLPALTDKISQLTGKPLTPPTIVSVKMIKANRSADGGDHDLSLLLNLLSRPMDYYVPALTLHFPPRDLDAEPKIVFAGGSFCWNLLGLLEGWPSSGYQRHIPFANYSRTYLDTGDFPLSRGTYESLLSESDVVVLEILEEVPEATIDGLRSIIDESAKAPIQSSWNVAFDEHGNSADFTSSGFSRQESAYRWSEGNDAILHAVLPRKTAQYNLAVKVRPYLSKAQTHQRLQIFADETLYRDIDLTRDEITTITATFPASFLLRLRFHFCNDVPAPELSSNQDSGPRNLGVAFYSLRIEPAAGPNPAK